MGDLSGISQVVVFSVYFEKRSKYEVSSGLAPDPLAHGRMPWTWIAPD